MNRKIIINADDFGLCEGVNKAVVKAHNDGVLTSATIMTNMPAAEEAIRLAKSMPGLGVGVHLNLTEGFPLTKDTCINCLTDSDGKFTLGPDGLLLRSLLSKKVRNAVKLELQAQIQWFFDKGLKPTHLDSHKHIHCIPPIFKIVVDLAARFAIPAVRWPLGRQKFSYLHLPKPDMKSLFRSRLINFLARINRFQNSKFFKTDQFFGTAYTGRISTSFFQAVSLYNSAKVAEIMTHPGYIEGLDGAQTRLLKQREDELNALCDEKTRLYFEKAKIELVHYGQL
jgi:hopanoid biosynthesis associated protein HpnK